MTSEFTLPDVGEGLTEAEIVEWKVAPGDSVEINQVLVEIETAKSLVELPSPYAGVVESILVEPGTTVDVGTPIIRVGDSTAPATPSGRAAESESLESGGLARTAQVVSQNEQALSAQRARQAEPAASATSVQSSSPAAPARSADAVSADGDTGSVAHAPEAPADSGSGAVLVGYGAAGGHGATRRRRPSQTEVDARQLRVAEQARRRPTTSVPAAQALPIIAKPPIRKLAKDLEVDLAVVQPTGLAGEVTRDDVIRHAQQASVFRNIETPEWGEERVERIPVKGVRKAIAAAMTSSAFTAPHVSLFVDVDATRTMEFVKRLKASPQFAGVKVSPLLIMAKAIIWAVRRNPMVNSAWTDREILVRHFVNLGIAAATPRGLIVPNVKEAQSMSLLELAQALEQLTLTARDGKTTPADMRDGTITITNIGVFGMDTGTPILNPGEVAIVALGTIKPKAWVVDGEVRSRMVTTIGASFDHRVVDGDVASRFVADVASVLEEPALLLD
ncbi:MULTISPECIES: dihydrolipoamide acetyltransferase family protein [unclassified Frigoribacterium]|uniref:dihydrolipoamide acetyltransferase family protein n=1 Tax=unclassified Frigoribacterium TaxID=2627005 RepID=UPI0006F20B77|nr:MULTISPECIES: dihydrolipoamide acetyltransferase family protein [unclassified Frigoribacterium]KQM23584.1 branched-chain alpha-keto acid dehydrogenase subunit E2 [Frigoribacterium sp. Leaf8]MBD8140061.1 2-oxo acid dehydrogenase subunit E2 [Frigoribacterium sp. CFBP 13605]WAC51792.1 2-oxo acid dehydrogenase subunit E2 [Frigoribacterium sp. SL97]